MSEPSDLFLPKGFAEKTEVEIAKLLKAVDNLDGLIEHHDEEELDLRREIARNRLMFWHLTFQLQLMPFTQATSPQNAIGTRTLEEVRIASNRLDVELRTSEEPLEDVEKWTKEMRQAIANRGLQVG